MHDSVQNSMSDWKQHLSLLIYHIYIFVLQECNDDNQQDKTQPLMKTVQNRRNRIANGMKQVNQHGWIIVHKTYFSLIQTFVVCRFIMLYATTVCSCSYRKISIHNCMVHYRQARQQCGPRGMWQVQISPDNVDQNLDLSGLLLQKSAIGTKRRIQIN